MGTLGKTTGRMIVHNSVNKDLTVPPKGDGTGKIKDLPSAIGYYELYAHDAKGTHNPREGKVSGLSSEEFMGCRERLQDLLNSPNPDVVKYGEKELKKLNSLFTDQENFENLENTNKISNEKLDSIQKEYEYQDAKTKPNWLQRLFGKTNDSDMAEIKETLDYYKRENQLYSENVVDYNIILKHISMDD